MALTPVQVQTIAQELPGGASVSLKNLFTTTDAEGLAITEYVIRSGNADLAAINLNGATNLATPAQAAAGDIVVSARDLANLTLTAPSGATSGLVNLYISAFDGVNWSAETGEAITLTANPAAISATPGLIMQAGSSIAATKLFTVSGYLNPSPIDTSYTLDPAPGSGVVNGNGAYNYGAGTFPGTFNVRGDQLSLLTYQAPTTPGYYNFVINVLPGNSGQPWSDWEQLNLTVTGPATSAATEIQNAAAGKPLYAAYVTDTVANILANLDALQANLTAGILYGVTVTDTLGAASVTARQFDADRGLLTLLDNQAVVTVTGMSITEAASVMTPGTLSSNIKFDLVGSAADLSANLSTLSAQQEQGLNIASISLTDSGTPVLDVSYAQALGNGVLTHLIGDYSIVSTGTPASFVAVLSQTAHVSSIDVTDSAADITGYLPSLSAAAKAGLLGSITLTDAGVPSITLQAGAIAGDLPVLDAIVSPFVLSQQVAGSETVTGFAGHGNVAAFSAASSDYAITGNGAGGLTVSGAGAVDHLSGINALQFSNQTVIVAEAPSATAPTSGNVAELYAAVLDRVPDIAGLAYYEGLISANSSLPMTTFAEWFLQSPEYTANGAHAYAQTATGDAEFITDTYRNLLHRAPGAGDVAWYQANVIAPILAGAAPGTAAYTAAALQAHAALLVDFSASAEFLSDVQIIAGHSADAQHWLFLS